MAVSKPFRAHRAVRLMVALCLAVAVGCGGGSAVTESANIVDVDVADSEDDGGAEHGSDEHDDGSDPDSDEHDDGDADSDDHDDDGDDHDDHDGDGDDHDDSSTGLGSHVHGAAELFVAWSGGDMVVDLVSPSNNIFGFEYEPVTDEDLALVSERLEMLTAPGVIAFNADADCQLAIDPDTELEFEGTHAEVTASWLFVCDNPAELRQLDAAVLFANFPGLEDVDAQWASDTAQSAAELSAASTILRFE